MFVFETITDKWKKSSLFASLIKDWIGVNHQDIADSDLPSYTWLLNELTIMTNELKYLCLAPFKLIEECFVLKASVQFGRIVDDED